MPADADIPATVVPTASIHLQSTSTIDGAPTTVVAPSVVAGLITPTSSLRCICPCVCICMIPCHRKRTTFSSSTLSTVGDAASASSDPPQSYCVRASWRATSNGTTDLIESYATYPCKLMQTKRAGKTMRARHTDDSSASMMLLHVDFDASSPVASSSSIITSSALYLTSYGGGLCSGDTVRMQMHVHERSTAQVASQGFTKIHSPIKQLSFQTPSPRTSSAPVIQRIDACVEMDGLLMYLPEPTMLYAGASFSASAIIELQIRPSLNASPFATPPSSHSLSSKSAAPIAPVDHSGSIVWLDWLYAGRTARGEVFDFNLYRNRLHVHAKIMNGTDASEVQPIILECMQLEQTTSGPTLPSSLSTRLHPYHSYLTVLLLGSRVTTLAARIHAEINKSRIDAVATSRHSHIRPAAGTSDASSSKMPRVLVSSQWIDVTVDGVTGTSNGRLTGCYLRVSSVTLEDSASVLRRYLSSLDEIASVPTPWQI